MDGGAVSGGDKRTSDWDDLAPSVVQAVQDAETESGRPTQPKSPQHAGDRNAEVCAGQERIWTKRRHWKPHRIWVRKRSPFLYLDYGIDSKSGLVCWK